MRKNFGPKAYMYPQPVLVISSYNEDNSPNTMVAAWGSCADYDKVAIYIAASHKSMDNILNRKAFTVSFADVAHIKQVDFLGIVSGHKDSEKFAKSGLHAERAENVDAPIITEFPVALECEFESYDAEAELCIARVVNVSAEESVLDADGKIDLVKLNAVVFDTVKHSYIAIGDRVGKAFSDGKNL